MFETRYSTLERRGGRLAVVSLAIVLLVSCAKEASVEVPPQAAPEIKVQAPELIGAWASSCKDADLFGLSQNALLALQETRFTKVRRYFSDGKCANPAVETTAEGEYATRPSAQSSVNEIDLTVATLRVRPRSQTGVQILKLATFCGISDWAVDQERDVSAAAGQDNCVQKLPQTVYDIYSVNGDKLNFGKGEEATDPAKRPTTLDLNFTYTKMP